ncbi:MAG: hypothetical protein MH204_07270 [Fimbriimonadaceae bacterium]|nr:hypothetical protein [Fimbriimonadaceae bacterium]
MKRLLLLCGLCLPIFLIGGCGDGDVSQADIQKGEAAAKAAPQTADALDDSMSPEARKSAENAIESSNAARQHMEKEGDAMRRAMQMRQPN